MALIDYIKSLTDPKPNHAKSSTDGTFGIDFSRFTRTKKFAGVVVDTSSALGLATVYTCIRDKAETISQLPINLYKDGRKVVTGQDRLRGIFCKRPNEYMTMGEMVSHIMVSLETNGVWYAYKSLNRFNNVSEIIPFRYQRNVNANMDVNGRVYYTYSTNDGKPVITARPGEIVKVQLMSLDGFTPMSPITAAARTIGVAISEEDYLGSLMESGAVPKGVLSTDQVFKDGNAIKRLKDEWKEKYGGVRKSGETPILEGGLKYQDIGVKPADAELIAQRVFSAQQICGIFRVPCRRAGIIVTGQTQRTVEEENNDYYRNAIMPIVVKIEDALNELLPSGFTLRFDESQFTRGDLKSQIEAVGSKFKLGSISINELRVATGDEPIEGGDVHAIDTNNLTFGSLTDIPKFQAMQNKPAQEEQPNE